MVCPPKLHKNLFTTGALDNIDHNPSATTTKDSSHGTAISLAQHPTENEQGNDRGATVLDKNLHECQRLASQLYKCSASRAPIQ